MVALVQRNNQESLVCSLLDLPIYDGNIEDIPDFIFKPNYKNCQVVLIKIHFKMFWINSLKDIRRYCTFVPSLAFSRTFSRWVINNNRVGVGYESAIKPRYTLGVISPFLHLSADKDNVIKNIIHHCCISSCLEEIRSVQKGMSTLGVSIVLFFSVSYFFIFFIAIWTIAMVTWSHVSFLAHLFLQLKLP